MNRLRALFRPVPLQWSRVELIAMRLGFACILMFSTIVWDLDPAYAEMPKPNGVAAVVPLGWLAGPDVLGWLKVVVAAGLALWVIGLLPAISLLPAVVAAVGTGAVRNSQGDISHHTQLPVMVLLAVWGVHVVLAVRRREWIRFPEGSARLTAIAAILTISAGYVASGIVKLDASDFRWIQKVPALGVQMIKSNMADYYSSLEPGPRFQFNTETAPRLVLDHPNVARLFFGTGLFLELFAFAMLLNRRVARWYAVALIAMHAGISFFMEIDFWNHLWLLLVFCVSLPGFVFRAPAAPATPESPAPAPEDGGPTPGTT